MLGIYHLRASFVRLAQASLPFTRRGAFSLTLTLCVLCLVVACLIPAQPRPITSGSVREHVLVHSLWIQVITKEADTTTLSSEEKTQIQAEAEAILDEVAR